LSELQLRTVNVLVKIEINKNQSVAELANKILSEWDDGKVFYISGREFDSPDQMREFYDAMMEHCGMPAEIGEAVVAGDDRTSDKQRSGLRWTEIRYDPTIPDAYRHSANPQPLHTDGSYVPSFPEAATIYCQSSASNGGETVFLDSQDLLGALEREDPELLKRLESMNVKHRRSGDEKDGKIIERTGADTRLMWNYYCVSDDVTGEALQLKEDFFSFLENNKTIKQSVHPVPLRTGECVIWKDHEVLHGRNGFDPKKPSERFLWKSAFAVNK